jgi:hypothetical protein
MRSITCGRRSDLDGAETGPWAAWSPARAFLLWAEEEARPNALPAKAGAGNLLYRGELPRGGAADLLGLTPRHARRIVSELGVMVSGGPRGPLWLAFPAALAARWMAGLFPEQGE